MSEANVVPMAQPDADMALRHLQFLFGREPVGYIEITGIRTAAEGAGAIETRYFDTGELEEAADHAVSLNKRPGFNVYVGAGPRSDIVRDEHGREKAARDEHVQGLRNLFADFDEGHDFEAAKIKLKELGLAPAALVNTGRTPTRRVQVWWPLEAPIFDAEEMRASLRGVQQTLGSDPAPTAAKQIMRLAGTLNWPKKEGRVLELCTLVMPPKAPQALMLEQMHRAFPPQAAGTASDATQQLVVIEPSGSLGITEKLADGHERYAFQFIRAAIRDFVGSTGGEPSGADLYAAVAPTYLRKWDYKNKPHRGTAFLKAKCDQGARDFQRGLIPGCRTLDEGVASWNERSPEGKPKPSEPDEEYDGEFEGVKKTSNDLFSVLSISDLAALPPAEWLIEDYIPEQGLGFIYGDPGSYKSFVALDLGLAMAYGHSTWLDKPVKQHGGVLYIAAEGAFGLSKRIKAWRTKHGVSEAADFHVIRESMSFMDEDDIDKLERTVMAVVKRTGPLRMVFVDTVSRVLPGADENLQKDMTTFVQACDRVRTASGATVIGVHHAGKSGDMRGSTVLRGAGDFVLKLEKLEEGKGGTLTCEKQKEAEDGWKRRFGVNVVEWVPDGHVASVSSLTLDFMSDLPPEKAGSWWPENRTLKLILEDISAAWNAGGAWSPYPQTRREGRFAIYNISSAFKLKSEVAQRILDEWTRTGVLVLETYDTHRKKQGLRVSRWPDWVAEVGGGLRGVDA